MHPLRRPRLGATFEMNKPIHIGLFLQGGRGWLGGFEYIKSILAALGAVPADVRASFRVTLITPDGLGEADQRQVSGLVDQTLCLAEEIRPLSTFRQRLQRKIKRELLRKAEEEVEKVLRRHGLDFVYPYTPPAPGDQGFAHASWIFDFQHKHLPEFASAEERERRDAFFDRVARLSPLVILSSQDAADDFRRYYPVAGHKARVFSFRTPQREWWYADDPVKIQHDYSLPDKFFLVANQFWKHKNHLLVFEALTRLADQGVAPTIVFTGNLSDSRFPEYTDTVLQTVQRLGIHPQVRLLGIVPKPHYVQLMRRSIAVVQPSLFEGWSTVVEDSRSVGKPIILSNLNVHREQDHPKAKFFDQSSAEDLARCMKESWEALEPGPDLAAEGETKRINAQEVQAQGMRFLEIAREAVKLR